MPPTPTEVAIMNPNQQGQLKSEKWRRHWEAWKESGMSQAEYGRRQELPIHAFRYWITKFNQPAIPATTALVKLPIQVQTARESSLELVVDKKYCLIIRKDFDSDLLRAVLSTMAAGTQHGGRRRFTYGRDHILGTISQDD
jgi:hypothetical protein